MTAEMAPGPARATPGGPAEPLPTRRPSSQSMIKYGVWVVVMTRSLGDRRFQASVITGALGAWALASLIKNNQARPVRRVTHWYTRLGDSKEL